MHSYSYADRPLAAHYEEISQKKTKKGRQDKKAGEKRKSGGGPKRRRSRENGHRSRRLIDNILQTD